MSEGAYHSDVHIRGHARVVADVAGFVGVVEDEAGVDGPRARRAWEAVEGCQAHGSVD